MKTADTLERPTFILGINKNNVILLGINNSETVDSSKQIYEELCNKLGLKMEVTEVEKDEVEQLLNNAKELKEKFAYLMQIDGGEIGEGS